MTQGKNKEFIKKEVNAETATNSKILLIKVFEVERYWAYAMHIKQKISQTIMDTKRAQKDMKEKFNQAAKSAEELFNLCKLKMPTDNTVFEAEAYYLFLKGQALIEDGKTEDNFKEALRSMHKANELYMILMKNKNPLTQILYKEKMDQIEPFIRVSLFKMDSKQEKGKKYFEEMKKEVKKEIDKQIETVKQEKIEKIKENYIEVHYGGKTVPLNTEALQMLYKEITRQQQEVEEEKGRQERIKLYSKLLTTLGNWSEEIKREKEEESKKSQSSAQLYNTLIDYTAGLKSDIVIKKLQLLILDAKDKFESEYDIAKLLRRKKSPKEAAMVGKIVILFINISKKVKQIKNAEKDFIDHKRMAGYEIQERVFRLLLLYYKAVYYALNNKLGESQFITQSIVEEAKKAEEYYKVNASSITNKDPFFDEAMSITPKAKKLECLVQCIYNMRLKGKKEQKQESPEERKARRAMKYKDAIKFIDEDKATTARLNSWIYNLDKAPNDLITPKGDIRKIKAEEVVLPDDPKKIRIVNELPEYKTLHVKPYLHDIATNFIKFPDFETINEFKPEKGGLFSKVKWFFGKS
jgi:hypothetical protein